MDDSRSPQISASDLGYGTLVERYSNLVKRTAAHLSARLPDEVLVEDLLQAGMLGLLEAAGRYDGSRGASFETYAGHRVRGAMLDEVRRGNWTPRSVHRNARRVAEALEAVETRTGCDPRDSEIATAMGVSLDDYHQMRKDAGASRLSSYEALAELGELPESAAEDRVAADVDRETSARRLRRAVSELPERERLVLAFYFLREFNLRQIGEVLGVSESRVSQILSHATSSLRIQLGDGFEST
jgi:RNA polymerase sigma factor for flagellar operon FliA